MDGGMTTPMAPPAAMRAQENAGEYPAFTMAGIIIRPRAATVAGPEPEIAAKKQDTATHTIAMPPLMWPRHFSARLISRPEIPAFSITLPERMKNGIARSTNLLLAEEHSRGRTLIMASIGFPAPWTRMAATLDMPRQMAMGAPKTSRTTKIPNNTIPTIYSPSFPSVPSAGGISLYMSIIPSIKAAMENAAPMGTKEP